MLDGRDERYVHAPAFLQAQARLAEIGWAQAGLQKQGKGSDTRHSPSSPEQSLASRAVQAWRNIVGCMTPLQM
jgi:hypothetical protein